ncbi:MAG: hypothetical protein LBU51_01085 [Bacteroidales bacterium]|jgi:hypothetical protein|nr:hypothetical protein [Bacteroidales bacterium]
MFGLNIDKIFPILEKKVKEEDIANAINDYLGTFPLEQNETRNMVIGSIEKDGKFHISVCGVFFNKTIERWQITKIKSTTTCVKLIKILLNYGKTNS